MVEGQSGFMRLGAHSAGLQRTVILGLIVCLMGGGGQATAADGAKVAVDRILALEKAERPKAVCAILESGILTEVFEIDPSAISYRPGSRRIPHPLCSARWDWPNKAEFEAACQEELTAQMERRIAATVARADFDEPTPECLSKDAATTVSLTMTKPTFASPAEAVASLESAVAELEEGITFNIGGKERTRQIDFDDFLDNVGDRAAWAPKLSELSVAHGGVRFAVSVQGAGDNNKSRSLAIDLAQKVIGAF